jgi:hypothetical protein
VSRRDLGRGRLLVGIGAIIALVATALPWYRAGGTLGLPLTEGNAFDGAGILVFLAAVAALAVLALPYASRDGRAPLDRPMTYLLLAGVGTIGLVLRVIQLNGQGVLGMPDRAPGLWLAGVGMLVIGWGVAEILAERPTA